jgi:hypothetical protein
MLLILKLVKRVHCNGNCRPGGREQGRLLRWQTTKVPGFYIMLVQVCGVGKLSGQYLGQRVGVLSTPFQTPLAVLFWRMPPEQRHTAIQ